MAFEQVRLSKLRELVSRTDVAPRLILNSALRDLAKWRSGLIAQTIVEKYGTTIQAGPFQGMAYVGSVAEGSLSARLLGSYEAALHSSIERIVDRRITTVIDIGSAEGYYAVGLARRMPWATVHAFDSDPEARTLCRDLALQNGVADRVHIGGTFQGPEFALLSHAETLVFCDIEGGELGLLDPATFPALRHCHVIVECHARRDQGISGHDVARTIAERFRPSHTITKRNQTIGDIELPPLFANTSHFDALLALWEWRATPTPWLVMEPKPEPGVGPGN